MQKDVVFGLQRGTEVLKMIHAEMGGLEAVERLVGENEEARRVHEEISEALAGRMSNLEEDEVEDELEAMEREVAGVKLPEAPVGSIVGEGTLPAAPTGELEEEREKRRKERAKARRVALEAG